jgi:hypothetical protein
MGSPSSFIKGLCEKSTGYVIKKIVRFVASASRPEASQKALGVVIQGRGRRFFGVFVRFGSAVRLKRLRRSRPGRVVDRAGMAGPTFTEE